jgi:hypothetical protein
MEQPRPFDVDVAEAAFALSETETAACEVYESLSSVLDGGCMAPGRAFELRKWPAIVLTERTSNGPRARS